MLTLYFASGSSSMAPHIALHEIGQPFEARSISFAAKETSSDAYLAVNPEGKVPTLLIDGRRLTEVLAILYYLARRFPDARLWPSEDIEAQAQMLSWMSFAASTLHPSRARGPEHALKAYAMADQKLQGKAWAVGDQYSIADIHLFRLYWRFRGGAKPAAGTFLALEDHYARMLQRPAVQQTLRAEAAAGYELPN